jgi:L-ascorbate metabolism protein UlaG (beta-lactamase superfamily)
MDITYYGHSTFGLTLGDKQLLFDPFISPNEKAAHLDIDQIPADYVLLSHGHQDHCADLLPIVQRTGATLVSNFELVSWFQAQGVEKAHPMNHGGSWTFDFGRVKYVNAVHSSSLPDGTYGGNPGGFIVYGEEQTFYYSGDTALHQDMKLIGEYDDLDFAFLCIGDNFTMGIDDAVRAADFIRCNKVIGMHYDTFGYIKIDHEAAKQKFTSNGKTLLLPGIGETFSI